MDDIYSQQNKENDVCSEDSITQRFAFTGFLVVLCQKCIEIFVDHDQWNVFVSIG